jgi:hypothetical protein
MGWIVAGLDGLEVTIVGSIAAHRAGQRDRHRAGAIGTSAIYVAGRASGRCSSAS